MNCLLWMVLSCSPSILSLPISPKLSDEEDELSVCVDICVQPEAVGPSDYPLLEDVDHRVLLEAVVDVETHSSCFNCSGCWLVTKCLKCPWLARQQGSDITSHFHFT